MHESYKKWLNDKCPKIYCNCPCHVEIMIKTSYKYSGIPKYIAGHWWLGKHHTKEAKIKIGKGSKDKHKSIEQKRKISNTLKGNIPWNKGKTNIYSQETLDKISNTLKGNIPWNKGVPRPEKTKQKISITKQNIYNDNNFNWNGYITPLYISIRICKQYEEWRLQIFGRDNFTCQCCGIRGTYLEAHHIKPLNEIIKEYNIKKSEDALNCNLLWDLNNGITYCTKCHKKLKNKGGLLS